MYFFPEGGAHKRGYLLVLGYYAFPDYISLESDGGII
jgi:hypothetical protein